MEKLENGYRSGPLRQDLPPPQKKTVRWIRQCSAYPIHLFHSFLKKSKQAVGGIICVGVTHLLSTRVTLGWVENMPPVAPGLAGVTFNLPRRGRGNFFRVRALICCEQGVPYAANHFYTVLGIIIFVI